MTRQTEYRVGDMIILNGFRPSKIRTSSLARTISGVQAIGGNIWYEMSIGTNTHGITKHHYHSKRIKQLVRRLPENKTLIQSKPIAHWRYCCGR